MRNNFSANMILLIEIEQPEAHFYLRLGHSQEITPPEDPNPLTLAQGAAQSHTRPGASHSPKGAARSESHLMPSLESCNHHEVRVRGLLEM